MTTAKEISFIYGLSQGNVSRRKKKLGYTNRLFTDQQVYNIVKENKYDVDKIELFIFELKYRFPKILDAYIASLLNVEVSKVTETLSKEFIIIKSKL